jgi:hypothetical protein
MLGLYLLWDPDGLWALTPSPTNQPTNQPTTHSVETFKPDPLGRKVPAAIAEAAACQANRAAKKNARRHAKRMELRTAGGRGMGGSGFYSAFADESDDEGSDGSPGSPAFGGSRGSPAKRSPAKGVGPTVYGSTLLMHDDPRLGCSGDDDDGWVPTLD